MLAVPRATRVKVGPVTEELPLGAKLDWTPVERPPRAPLRGEHVVLRPVDAAADAEALYAASHPPQCDPAMWMYLPYGPFEGPDEMAEYLARRAGRSDRVSACAPRARGGWRPRAGVLPPCGCPFRP